MKVATGIIHDTAKLRQLMQENPELPVVILAGESANCGEWSWQYCYDVDCNITEILDIKTPWDGDTLFTDRDDFEQAIEDSLYGGELSIDQIEAAAKREAAMYENCWRKVIAVYADNP